MKNLYVVEPMDKFLDFLNTHGYSHELKNSDGTKIIEVDNYKVGKYNGIVGLDALILTDKGWVRL